MGFTTLSSYDLSQLGSISLPSLLSRCPNPEPWEGKRLSRDLDLFSTEAIFTWKYESLTGKKT